MILFRSILFNILFFGSTTVIALLACPALLFGRRAVIAVRNVWLDYTMLLVRWVAGIRVEIRGAEHRPRGAALIAAKHQSAWETLWFSAELGEPAIVLKKELTEIPIFGGFINGAGMVPIDRKAGASSLKKIVGAAKPAIAEGRPVLIFPQGTRVAPGHEKPYQPGVFALYRALGLPVTPVALNSGCYWPRNAFAKRPGTVVVEFLEPIEPGLDRKTFMARLETAIETASSRLAEEAGRSVR